jgi:polysaccharide export outer membrane protein
VSNAPPTYTIAAGDLLSVEVFGMKDLDRRGRVLGDGTLPLPVVGGVPVAGLTPTQAEKAIGDALVRNGLLRSPQVLIVVEESALRQVSMQGAVRRPGLYPLVRPRSLLEMVSEAGGFDTNFDPRQKLLILRRAADGRQQRIEIDGARLLDYGDPALDALLQPGDVVVAPAAQQLEVYVSGAVQRPGPIKFLSSAGMSVLRALTAAGGPTERARLSNVRIIRRKADGGQQTITVDVAKVRKGKAEDVLLQDGDTVVVLEWFF